MVFFIKLAGRTVRAEVCYPSTERFCRAYLTEPAENPDISVTVGEKDIQAEAEGHRGPDGAVTATPQYLEKLALYRAIAECMPAFDTVLFHGSVLSVDGAAYCFTAPSGTGKSTHAALWRACFGDRVRMINDDKPLFRFTDSGIFACGTPWNGKHGLGENTEAPLRAVFLLERAAENSAQEIPFFEAYPDLFLQTYRPEQPGMLQKTLQLMDRFPSSVRFYRLKCNMDPEAARTAYRAAAEN